MLHGSKVLVMSALAWALVAAPALAQEKTKSSRDDHAKQDIAIHRAMAQAHEAAAKCLESGKPEKECHAQLAKDCRGLAVGKYCGMRHRH